MPNQGSCWSFTMSHKNQQLPQPGAPHQQEEDGQGQLGMAGYAAECRVAKRAEVCVEGGEWWLGRVEVEVSME